jgi:hypothetical protein
MNKKKKKKKERKKERKETKKKTDCWLRNLEVIPCNSHCGLLHYNVM